MVANEGTIVANQQQSATPPRSTPVSELDMQYRVTDPAWGRDATQELREKLGNPVLMQNEDGTETLSLEGGWGLLGYYTRDLRLANLNEQNNEVEYCNYYLDLAGDCLREEYPQSFLTAISRMASVMEISQSKGGFFRKLLNTFRSEQSIETIEPKKSTLGFGQRPKG